jgi:hypothetical protein
VILVITSLLLGIICDDIVELINLFFYLTQSLYTLAESLENICRCIPKRRHCGGKIFVCVGVITIPLE